MGGRRWSKSERESVLIACVVFAVGIPLMVLHQLHKDGAPASEPAARAAAPRPRKPAPSQAAADQAFARLGVRTKPIPAQDDAGSPGLIGTLGGELVEIYGDPVRQIVVGGEMGERLETETFTAADLLCDHAPGSVMWLRSQGPNVRRDGEITMHDPDCQTTLTATPM